MLSDYIKEIEKYDPRRGNISKQKFNKIIENYFKIEKFTKKVDGKAEQVINVIEKKPLPTREFDIEYLKNDIYCIERFIDFLAHHNNPLEYISLEDYDKFLNDLIDNKFHLTRCKVA